MWIKITKGNYWYKDRLGFIFSVEKVLNDKYIVTNEEGDDNWFVDKNDCSKVNYLQVCKTCGSLEVARCKWVNVNSSYVYSEDSGTTLEWCFDCRDETTIVEQDKFKK